MAATAAVSLAADKDGDLDDSLFNPHQEHEAIVAALKAWGTAPQTSLAQGRKERLLRQLCDVRRVLGDVPGAAAAGQDLLKACEQRHGPASLPVASALRALASVYRTSSDMRPLAKPLLLRAMGILTRHLGGDHEKVAAALTSLAVLSMREGQSEEAARYHKKALEMRSRLQSEGKGPASDGADDDDGGSDSGGGGGKEGATKGSHSGGTGDAGAADSEEEEGQVLDFKTFEWKASDEAA